VKVFDEVSEEKQAREYLRRKRLKKPEDQKTGGADLSGSDASGVWGERRFSEF